jgi:hypothetical protein
MNKNKKYLLLIPLILLISLFVFHFFKNSEKNIDNNEGNKVNNVVNDNAKLNYLLEGYPIDEVPLYKLTKISSSKFFVGMDPSIISSFDEKDFNYYNVVLETEASQSEFLDYYKNLFEKEYVEEYPSPDMVKGYVGKYRVTAAHYDSDNTGYIQVHLPKEEYTKTNKYFDTYPNLFESDSMFVEGQNSYGLLNQVGGQVEYSRFFTVLDSGDINKDGIDDVDEFSVLIEKFKAMYKDKPDYAFEPEQSVMTWKEVGYSVSVSFSRDHGRIYLNMRGSMDK